MQHIELLQGDCLELLKQGPDCSIDAVVTDPPYGIDYQSSRKIDPTTRQKKIAGDKRPFIWWLYDAFRALKPGGALLCFCRWDTQEAFRMAIEAAGFDVKSQLSWDRVAHGMGDLKASFAPQHDVIWFAVKGGFTFPGKRPKSVIPATRKVGQVIHPTEKPVDLMKYLVEAVTPPGGIVLDPFMGSGSTGVAAKELGFSFIGMELDPGHFKTASDRINLIPTNNTKVVNE